MTFYSLCLFMPHFMMPFHDSIKRALKLTTNSGVIMYALIFDTVS